MLEGEQSDEERRRPNETVCKDLGRRNGAQQFPINRDETPRSKSGDARDEAGAIFAGGRAMFCRRGHRAGKM